MRTRLGMDECEPGGWLRAGGAPATATRAARGATRRAAMGVPARPRISLSADVGTTGRQLAWRPLHGLRHATSIEPGAPPRWRRPGPREKRGSYARQETHDALLGRGPADHWLAAG